MAPEINGIEFLCFLHNDFIMKNLKSFTLFEVLIAWAIFISAFLMLSTVQLNCLKRVRLAYLQNLAVIQLVNISQEFEASDSLDRVGVYNEWHKLTMTLFSKEQDQWHCNDQQCCFEITWQPENRWIRYCSP